MPTERVTVTLPSEMVEAIDHVETNRSRFITQAVERELARRRREGLRRSLAQPHPEIMEVAEAGMGEWGARLPEEDGLVDLGAGSAVRWVEGQGWVEDPA